MATVYVYLSRDDAIKQIKSALESRSDLRWSVTGGRGTGYGWLRIDAPPSRRTWVRDGQAEYDRGTPGGHMSPADRAELGKLLGLDGPVHFQGHSVPASSAYYREYIERAEGRPVTTPAKPYWD